MPAYDSGRFDPPAPVAFVTIRHNQTQTLATNVPMLLDTGADVSLLPQSIVEQLNLSSPTNMRYELAGFDGARSFSMAVEAELVFLKRKFRGQFLVIEQPVGVLGRNILNTAKLVLDGPHLIWAEA